MMPVDDPVWRAARFVAHRCGGRLAPENTLAGLRIAAARGFRAVEFDVMLTGDGIPILLHDETLDRTTSGSGPASAASRSLLATLVANRGFEDAFPDARIPELGAALTLGDELGLAMNVEIKPSPGRETETASVVAQVLADFLRAPDRRGPLPLIASFSEAALAIARPRLPELPFALLVDRVPEDWQKKMQRLGCSALHTSSQQSNWDWIAAARQTNVPVRCYTVNDSDTARALFARGVDALFTDALDVFSRPDASATTRNKP